jgi:hypothetical protein
MSAFLLRRVLPLLVLGSLSLASCTVHEHDSGYRGRDRGDHRHDRGRWHGRDHRDYGYQRGRY